VFDAFFSWLPNVQLAHFLVVSAVLFGLGLYAILTRRNAIMVLMGIELVLNAANINLIAFARYGAGGPALDGQMAAIFVIILAAAEAAIALAIILNIYHRFQTVNVDEVSALKE
jgi:NADH-quinone oxidoreductase subunit K